MLSSEMISGVIIHEHWSQEYFAHGRIHGLGCDHVSYEPLFHAQRTGLTTIIVIYKAQSYL